MIYLVKGYLVFCIHPLQNIVIIIREYYVAIMLKKRLFNINLLINPDKRLKTM